MTTERTGAEGLTGAEAKKRLAEYGMNEITPRKKENFIKKILHIICEPMFLLLIAAAVIYFILGEPRDGAVMLIFVVGIIGIDTAQEWKTDRTLNALRELSAPRVTVRRDGEDRQIPSAELVPGDVMMICEGVKIPADGIILRCADLCVDESSLTGESQGVWKNAAGAQDESGHWRRDRCYAGTLAIQGTASVLVENTGVRTEFGKIGLGVAQAKQEDTPLQKQTAGLVKTCAAIAAVLFALVALFTWFNIPDHSFRDRLIESILSGVTLAMAMIPEEFPVILTVFLSMGAWRLAKKHSLVRRLPSVETLGAVSVLCVDKTGTITMNNMTVQEIWASGCAERELLETMGLGCETDTYDPMEKAMLRCCEEHGIDTAKLLDGELAAEYAFTSELKMMGHVWRRDGGLFIAAKGSPERILSICAMPGAERDAALKKAGAMASQGLRVIAVACEEQDDISRLPETLTGCRLTLLGLVGLSDPPRGGVKENIAELRRAGVRVVMITGDNGGTASAIAKKVGIPGGDFITGDRIDTMSDAELREAVRKVSIFSRVIPEHKMRIVRALKENGETVAMTGDGVNDAPALKYADIGIAMGRRGSEVSREAADLILMDDNFSTIVGTVRDGRRIYANIRRAMGYVLAIHIPIAFASLLAPLMGIPPSDLLLLPLHVVLLEIIIDPTCSVVLERQPAQADIMERKPRSRKEKLLGGRLMIKSLLQGLAIFAASFGAYYYTLSRSPSDAPAARATGLAVIMLANLFLVQVNSSDTDPVCLCVRRLAKDWVMWAVNLGTAALLGVIIFTPVSAYLELASPGAAGMLAALGLAAASVMWYEPVKLVRAALMRRKNRENI
jgi:Ca2+-transporting ATPase